MNTVRMVCVDVASAQKVIEQCEAVEPERRGDNTATREGATIVIGYVNPMWPYDIINMAAREGWAGDEQAARALSQI